MTITNTGTGQAGRFRIDNPNSEQFALHVSTIGEEAALGVQTAGSGSAGYFRVMNANSNHSSAVYAENEANGPAGFFSIPSSGSGDNALEAQNEASGRAGYFTITSPGNNSNALEARTSGNGSALYARTLGNGTAIMGITDSGAGKAGLFRIDNSSNSEVALNAWTEGSGWAGQFIGSGGNSKGVRIWVANNSRPGLEVANGTKNGVVATSDGARALYAEEAAEVWFSDYGFGQLQAGEAQVQVDAIFAQTVDLELPYHVFLQPYGNNSLYVSERNHTGFVVLGRDGDDDVEFSYRIVAKRRGYEKLRLERTPWADTDPNLYPERRKEWEAQFTPAPSDATEEVGGESEKS